MLSLLLSWALITPPAVAQSADEEARVEHHLDQARLFVQKGWTQDALAELEAVLDTDAGRSSFALHELLAQVSYTLLNAEDAGRYARIGAELSLDPASALPLRQFADFIDRNFGILVLRAPHAGVVAHLDLSREDLLLDPDLKTFAADVAARWSEEGQVLPLRVAIPAGGYSVNDHTLVVSPGQETELTLPLGDLGRGALAALAVSRMEFSSGVGILASEALSNLRPSLELQIAVTQPIGPWLIGAEFSHALRDFEVEGQELQRSPQAMSTGLRFGREILFGGVLAARASLGYRIARVPGIQMTCARWGQSQGEEYLCHQPESASGATVLAVYAVGTAHIPFVEISLESRHFRRTTALGMGVKVVGETAIGRLASPAQALTEGGETVSYATADRNWTARGLRLLGNVSYAF